MQISIGLFKIMATRQIAAGVVIYRKTKEGYKFLILYHGKSYWNFPKGKIESEEKSFQTAVREVKEETGLSREDLKFIENFKAYENFSFWLKGPARNASPARMTHASVSGGRSDAGGTERTKVFKTVIFYLAETRKSQIKIPEKPGVHEQYEGYGWFTYREALKILSKHKDSQKVLTQAHNSLRRKQFKPKEKTEIESRR